MKRTILTQVALLALAVLVLGPQGVSGWRHASLHGHCGAETPSRDHPGGCDPAPAPAPAPEFGLAGCWICDATLLAPADVAPPVFVADAAPPRPYAPCAPHAPASPSRRSPDSSRAPPLS